MCTPVLALVYTRRIATVILRIVLVLASVLLDTALHNTPCVYAIVGMRARYTIDVYAKMAYCFLGISSSMLCIRDGTTPTTYHNDMLSTAHHTPTYTTSTTVLTPLVLYHTTMDVLRVHTYVYYVVCNALL